MLTKGIIQSIDYLDNTCTIRIPVFETAGTKEAMLAQSTLISLPGVYGGYKVNDVVIIGFENEEYGDPIILGKLFLGNVEESKKDGGAINCTNLNVSSTAILPAETKINFKKPEDAIKNKEATLITYNSLQDIAEAVSLNSKRINNITVGGNIYTTTEQVVGSWLDGSLLYQKTFYYSYKEGVIMISLSDLNFNTIWIDAGQSFYVDSIDGDLTVSNNLLTSINLTNKSITVPSLTSEDGYGYVTVKYTKKK